jgi:hypothetical protein
MWFVLMLTISKVLILKLATDSILMENLLFDEIRQAANSEAWNQVGV